MSDEIDLDKLEALARAATPGPWSTSIDGPEGAEWDAGMAIAATYGRQKVFARAGGSYPRADQEYIAAASPDVVLALIERLRRAESDERPEEDPTTYAGAVGYG